MHHFPSLARCAHPTSLGSEEGRREAAGGRGQTVGERRKLGTEACCELRLPATLMLLRSDGIEAEEQRLPVAQPLEAGSFRNDPST